MNNEIALLVYDNTLYALWCPSCKAIKPMWPEGDDIKCQECGQKMGERLDPSFVKFLLEGGVTS